MGFPWDAELVRAVPVEGAEEGTGEVTLVKTRGGRRVRGEKATSMRGRWDSRGGGGGEGGGCGGSAAGAGREVRETAGARAEGGAEEGGGDHVG